MIANSDLSAVSLSGLRVLVVDNDAELREQTVGLLRRWGCQPFAPEGNGDALMAKAREAAARHCCQLAVVDMRLGDDSNTKDISGLELLDKLRPTLSIIMSAFGSVHSATEAFREYGAVDFVAKEDGPEVLQQALQRAVVRYAIGARHIQIEWSDDLNAAMLSRQLFAGRASVPRDEATDLIGRMFPSARRVVLTTITDNPGFADAPLSSTGPTTLRRESRVFLAQVDDQPALMVIKIGKRQKIEREVTNYRQHVDNGLQTLFRPEMRGHMELWNMGAVSYRLVGNADIGTSDGPRTFTRFYRSTREPAQILIPLHHFFEQNNWGNWYNTSVMPLGRSLFDAYDEILHGKLSRNFPSWAQQDRLIPFAGIDRALPNPMRWLSENYRRSNEVRHPRQAITHGDLHGDNLFTSSEHAWPIDFERTGTGPILRDFVEIIQDIMTRIAAFRIEDALVVYDLAVALCEPYRTHQGMRPTTRILAHPEASKAFEVVRDLQLLAIEHARFEDRREYLWGLLFNHLFVLSRIAQYVSSPRYQHTLLMASVICERLSRWSPEAAWPPKGWPEVQWPAPATNGATKGAVETCFAHGHALLVGVGGDLPNTIDDARGLAELLRDPQRCAYAPEHVALLTGPQATRDAILAGLDRLAAVAGANPETAITVYFSGHGVLGPESFLLPAGYQLHALPATAISGAEFTARLHAISARRLLVLLDCCYAGGLAEAKGAGLQPIAIPPELNALEQGSGRVLIASSRRDEVSYAGKPYSVFTQALREALAGYGAAEPDGYAYVADVAMYVGRKVPERTSGKQHPILKLAAADNFPIAYYAGGDPTPKQLPDTTAALQINALVSDLSAGYRQVLRKHQENLLQVELRMADFIDQAAIPLDLERTRADLLERIARSEAQLRSNG